MQEEENPKTKGTFRHSGRRKKEKKMEHFDIQEEQIIQKQWNILTFRKKTLQEQ